MDKKCDDDDDDDDDESGAKNEKSIDDDARAIRRAACPPPHRLHSPLRYHLAESTPILIDAEPYERLLLHPRGAVACLLFLTGMGDVPVFSLHDIGVGDPM
jgi:hypothetical protein